MAHRTTVVLDDHFGGSFIDTQIGAGLYESPADVLLAGLRLLEDRQKRLSILEAELIKGEQSGLAVPFDFEAFIAGKEQASSK